MADEIVLGVKIRLDGREVDGQVRLLTEDVNRLSQAVREEGAAAQQSAQQTGNLSRSVSEAGAASESAAQGMSRMASFAKIAGVAIGAGIAALAGFAKNGIESAAALQEMADRSGIAVEKLAGLELATQLAGTSMDALIGSSSALSVNIVKNAADFAKLGVTAKDPYEAMLQLADVFASIDDPQKRAAFGAKALGASYAELAPLLIQGSDALREQVAQGQAFSGVTAKDAAAAANFASQIDTLKVGLHGLSITIGTVVLPWINRLLEQLGAVPESLDTINQKIAQQRQKVAVLKNEGGIGGLIDGLLGYDASKEQRKLDVLERQKSALTQPPVKIAPIDTSAIDAFILGTKKAKTASDAAAKSEERRRAGIQDTLDTIRQETALIGLGDKERQRAIELTHALASAKGAEKQAITEALQVKWAELDADQRRSDMWDELVKQANALDKLHDDAAEAKRLATLAKELQIQGLSNEAIQERIDLEKQLASAREANPDLDSAQVEQYVKQRRDAEKTLADITDEGSRKSADFMQAAWKKAAENIQDAFAQMFENLLNGDVTNSFDDFLNNIVRSINRVFAQGFSQAIQGYFTQSFTSGSGGSGGGFFGGLFDGIKNLFGGSSGNPFQGNGPLLSYQNGSSAGFGGQLSNFFGNFFNTGKGGGFSFSGSGGGGSGWAALGSLAQLIPGAGQLNWKGGQQNKLLQTWVGVENQITDLVGNFFPLFKLITPLKNFALNFGSKLFPDRQPSLVGHLLGSAFGPIGDALFTFLLGKKIPEPQSTTTGKYTNGNIKLVKSTSEQGGDINITRNFTTQFGELINGLGYTLDQSFADFFSVFTHKFDFKGRENVAGSLSDRLGVFYEQGLTRDKSLKELAESAALAVVKHNISRQDDLHYREAIRKSATLPELNKRIKTVNKIEFAIGETSEAKFQLAQINAEFDKMAKKAAKYRFDVADIEAARQRAISALKNETITEFRELAGLGPTLAAQLGSLNDQLIKLEANARSLKIAESELAGLRAKAIALAKEQYLSPLTDVSTSITDQIAQLTGVLPQPEDVAPLYQLLAASTDPTEQARYIDRIQRAMTQRYNIEIAQINKTAQAVNSLKDFVDSLKLGDLSTLNPEEKLREAQGQYGTTLLKAQAGDQTALANLPGAAQDYLSQARSYYASSPEYAAIFSNVTETLTSLGASLGGSINAEDAATNAANQLATSLQSLSDLITSIIATAGGNFDTQAPNYHGTTPPGKNFRDITEDQIAANIASLPAHATAAQKKEVKAENRDLRQQIKAWLFGGDEELAKTQAYQELTGAIKDIQAEIKALKKNDPNRSYLKAQLSGLLAQRKALGKVKFKEQGGWTQGLTVVGENGPELINFARPTQVQSNRQTQSIIAGGNDKLVAELQKANDELAALVRLQMLANQQLIERLDRMANSMGTIERKTRLESAA